MFEGVFPALITPFKSDGSLDEEGVRNNIEFAINGGVSGIVPCGSTGESATLSHDEHKRLVDIAVDASSVPVIAGTGSNNTAEAVDLTKHAEKAGVDAAMLITPYYNKPNRDGMINHFRAAADSVSIPIIVYNVPSRTGINLAPDIVAELAKVDNIVGVKEASGDLGQMSDIIRLTMDQEFFLISGDDGLTLPIMALGGTGVISVAANIVPDRVSSMVSAMLDGDLNRARTLHYELEPLIDALFLETNPIPVKKAAELIGLAAGPVRLPLAPLGVENEKKLIQVLTAMGVL